ncbi:phage integrase [Rhizobium rhizogenes]|uniref:Phage integrase protein n=1 Tax=Rhizobium rhizogenes (strain K84 / ATCC BAA-868) TaxID=311403 RepID=B9J9F2_RHIR8|nr:phage integrase protein [Rhizobium rhizogenes K84]
MRTDRPGYQSRRRPDGSLVHYWNPQRAVKGASKSLGIVRLADDSIDEQIVAECQRRTQELRIELMRDGAAPTFDGTIKSLAERYRRDTTSSWHSVKFSTRIRDYEPSLRVIEKNVGEIDIHSLKGSDFKRWFSQWKKKGHRRATGCVKLLRVILSYGAGERLRGCKQARDILSGIRFDLPASRKVAMTYDQCLAIVQASAELKCPSIGFVEALKFESALRRIDVIGEWVPNPEDGPFLWRGLTVENLTKDLILKLKTSKTGVEMARDLKVMPLVVEALKAYRIPEIGPVVIDEDHGKPYWDNRYTIKFRKVRAAAGVPDDVWSMDTRAGAVSETVEATGSLELASNLATHSTTKMTKKYSRGDGLKTGREIAEARTANRASATATEQ